MKYYLPGQLIAPLRPYFIGGWSCTLCLACTKMSGKQVFSINHIVVQQVGHSEPLLSGRGLIHTLNPSSQGILQVKGQPCSQAFQGTVVSSLLWSFLSAHGYITIYSATSNWRTFEFFEKVRCPDQVPWSPWVSSLLLCSCLVSGALIKLGPGSRLWSAWMLPGA